MLYTALIGAAVTLALLQFRRMPLPVILKSQAWSARLHAPETGIPYGAAMAPAALLLLPHSHWFAALL
jgi:prepilin peptidase CpaA